MDSHPARTLHPVPVSPAQPVRPVPVQPASPLPAGLTHQVGRTGYLESYALGVTLLVAAGVAAIAAIATVVLRRRRGRRVLPGVPRWVAVPASVLTILLLALTGGLVMLNNYVGYVPTVGALIDPTGATTITAPPTATAVIPARFAGTGHHRTVPQQSRVVRLAIPDYADGVPHGAAFVYLPPGYGSPANAHRRYPVVYLYHGFPGRPEDWFTAGGLRSTMDLLLRDGYVGPMIVVSPSVSTGYLNDDECLDAPGHFNLERYLAITVVDTIDQTFRTIPDRSHRAIGGMSSGGYCALNVGVHHLHRFSVILASEPYGDPGLHPLHRLLHGDWSLWRANSPSFYLPMWRFTEPVATFLDSGVHDRFTTTAALRIARQFAARGEQAVYRAAPGQHHNWREAHAALPYALIFAWQHFGRMPDGGSDAADAAEFARILHLASQPAVPVAARKTG